jgi:hypothetical protein
LNGDARRRSVKYDKRGRHPNSLRNLKPRRKGQPSLNPNGRAGKNALGQYWVDKRWLAYVRSVEKDIRFVDRMFRKHLGCSIDRACDVLKRSK